jgi:hypothetical protein
MKSRILSQKSDCSILRAGSHFVVGIFEDKSMAEAIAADLRSLSKEIVVEIVKK